MHDGRLERGNLAVHISAPVAGVDPHGKHVELVARQLHAGAQSRHVHKGHHDVAIVHEPRQRKVSYPEGRKGLQINLRRSQGAGRQHHTFSANLDRLPTA